MENVKTGSSGLNTKSYCWRSENCLGINTIINNWYGIKATLVHFVIFTSILLGRRMCRGFKISLLFN